jgi:hypothetical protein
LGAYAPPAANTGIEPEGKSKNRREPKVEAPEHKRIHCTLGFSFDTAEKSSEEIEQLGMGICERDCSKNELECDIAHRCSKKARAGDGIELKDLDASKRMKVAVRPSIQKQLGKEAPLDEILPFLRPPHPLGQAMNQTV